MLIEEIKNLNGYTLIKGIYMYDFISTLRGQEYLNKQHWKSLRENFYNIYIFHVLIRFVLKYALTYVCKGFELR